MTMWKTGTHPGTKVAHATARRAGVAGRSPAGRLLRSSHGSGLVEFALVLPLLMVVILAIFEYGRLSLYHLTARHAVAEATRYAVTGQQLRDPGTGEPIGRAESIRLVLKDNVGGLSLIADSAISIDPADGGGPEDLVTVAVSFTYEYFVPGLADVLPPVDFTIRTSMKNEPFIR